MFTLKRNSFQIITPPCHKVLTIPSSPNLYKTARAADSHQQPLTISSLFVNPAHRLRDLPISSEWQKSKCFLLHGAQTFILKNNQIKKTVACSLIKMKKSFSSSAQRDVLKSPSGWLFPKRSGFSQTQSVWLFPKCRLARSAFEGGVPSVGNLFT